MAFTELGLVIGLAGMPVTGDRLHDHAEIPPSSPLLLLFKGLRAVALYTIILHLWAGLGDMVEMHANQHKSYKFKL